MDNTKSSLPASELLRALRRKHVLDNYGITIENVTYEKWLEIISSDQRLAEWFGHPLEDYVLRTLAALEGGNE